MTLNLNAMQSDFAAVSGAKMDYYVNVMLRCQSKEDWQTNNIIVTQYHSGC